MGFIVDIGQEKETDNVRNGGEADELHRLLDRLDFAGSGVDGCIGGAEYFIAEGDIPADKRFEFAEGGSRALELRQQFQDHQTVGGTPGQSHQVSDRILSKYAWSHPARFCFAAMPPWAEGS